MALITDNPFALILTTCAHAAAVAKHVEIDQSGLHAFCNALSLQPVKAIWEGSMGENSDTRPYSSFPSSREAVTYAVLFGLMQFGHGFRYELHQALGGSGASKMITAGMNRLAEAPLSARRLSALTVREVSSVFALSSLPELQPLVNQILQVLVETGNVLQRMQYDDMYDFVIAVLQKSPPAGGGAALVRALANSFPAYADRGILHDGSTVWLLKKAQLSVAELQRVVGPHDARFCFADINQLTAIVDNVVPAMLVKYSVLRLDPALASHIQSRKPLPRGPQEAELRAVAIRACDLITEGCQRQFNSAQLTYYLWKSGKENGNRQWERHLTQDTIFY